MRRLLILFLVTICAISTARASDPHPDAVVTLIRLEHAWQQAVLSGNKRTLRNILAHNFLDTSYKGVLRTKKKVLADMESKRHYTAALSDLKVRLFGNAAIVTGLNTVTGPDNAWTAKLRFTDVFVKRENHWQAVGAQESIDHVASGRLGASK